MRQRGARSDLVARLFEMAEGWFYLCRDDLAVASFEGASALEGGAHSVRVGHTVYEVDESGDESGTECYLM